MDPESLSGPQPATDGNGRRGDTSVAATPAHTHKEYLLCYEGKQSEAEILANTPAFQFQRMRSFGDVDGNDWHNLLISGDNLPALRHLLEMKRAGKLKNADGTDGVRLVYIDPPFASDADYETKSGVTAYSDKAMGAEFIEGLRKRLILIRKVMADDAAIFLHLDWRKIHYLKVIMDEVFGEHTFVNEIAWHYRTYQGQVTRYFPRKHDTLLFYARGTYPFRLTKDGNLDGAIDYKRWSRFLNDENEIRGDHYPTTDIRFVPLLNKWIREHDGRQPGPDDVLYKIEGNTVDSVWDIKAVDPKSKKRIDYPTQKPEELAMRIIESASNEGDIVLDCFVGSGTTIAAAEKMNRRWIGVDIGINSIYTTQKRIFRIAGSESPTEKVVTFSRKRACCDTPGCEHCATHCCLPVKKVSEALYGKPARPFAVYASGHYDFFMLQALPFAEYRTFVMRLIEATEQPEIINGIRIDGRDGRGDPVIIYDFNADPDAKVTAETIEDYARFLTGRVYKRVLFVAPASSLALYDNRLTYSGITFEIRRVPWAAVEALSRFGQQPVSRASINKMLEKEVFDFAAPLDVEITVDETARTLTVTHFHTWVIASGLTDEERGFPALAMVLVDYDHDDKVFDLDATLFHDELEQTGFTVSLDGSKRGEDIAVIFCDAYGNEHIEYLRDRAWGGKP